MTWPTYTLLEARTLVRQRADMVNSDFVSDTEVTQAINDSVGSLTDLLISTQGARQWSIRTTLNFNQSSTETGAILPVYFYKPVGIGLRWPRSGTKERIIWLDPLPANADRPLKATDWEIELPRYLISRDTSVTTPPATQQQFFLSLFPIPTAAWDVHVEYYPIVRYTADANLINIAFPDFYILDAASKLATKEQNAELVTILQAERAEMEKRIRAWGTPIDRGQAGFLNDVRGELEIYSDGWS